MDDILIFGQTQEEHDVRLHRVLKKFNLLGLPLTRINVSLTKNVCIS